MNKLFTIGYGNSAWEEVMAAVGTDRILVDVRSKPYSRWRPVFNMPVLRSRLGARYHSFPDLGGLEGVDPEKRSAAIETVRGLLRNNEVVIMCAEKDPAKCHRTALAAEIAADQTTVTALFAIPAKPSKQMTMGLENNK